MKCILILTWFLSHGYSQVEANDIVTNLYVESKCNQSSNNGSQIGLAQWQGKRKLNLISFAKSRLTPWTNLFLQLEFLDKEWKTISQRNSHVAHHSTSYAIYFCQKFERPKFSCQPRERISKLKPWEREK